MIISIYTLNMDGDEAGRRTADGCHQCPPLQSTVMCCTGLDGTGLDWIGRVCHCLVRYSTVRRYKGRDWKPVGALGDCEVALALRTTSCTSLPACQPASLPPTTYPSSLSRPPAILLLRLHNSGAVPGVCRRIEWYSWQITDMAHSGDAC